MAFGLGKAKEKNILKERQLFWRRSEFILGLTDEQIMKLLPSLVTNEFGPEFLICPVTIDRGNRVALQTEDNRVLCLFNEGVTVYDDYAMRCGRIKNYSAENMKYIVECLKLNGVDTSGYKDIAKLNLRREIEEINEIKICKTEKDTKKAKDIKVEIGRIREMAANLEKNAADALTDVDEMEKANPQKIQKDTRAFASDALAQAEVLKTKASAMERDANEALRRFRELEDGLMAMWGSQNDAWVNERMAEIFGAETSTSKDAAADEGLSNKR